MFREDIDLVYEIARQVAKEEITKAFPPPTLPGEAVAEEKPPEVPPEPSVGEKE